MQVLSIAHMCDVESFVDKNGQNNLFYNGPSPDEVALVEFANAQQYKCLNSNDEKITMNDQEFHVYRKMEFNSDRKRMSVLIKDPRDGKIKLLIKGADSIIKERLDNSQYPSEM